MSAGGAGSLGSRLPINLMSFGLVWFGFLNSNLEVAFLLSRIEAQQHVCLPYLNKYIVINMEMIDGLKPVVSVPVSDINRTFQEPPSFICKAPTEFP